MRLSSLASSRERTGTANQNAATRNCEWRSEVELEGDWRRKLEDQPQARCPRKYQRCLLRHRQTSLPGRLKYIETNGLYTGNKPPADIPRMRGQKHQQASHGTDQQQLVDPDKERRDGVFHSESDQREQQVEACIKLASGEHKVPPTMSIRQPESA